MFNKNLKYYRLKKKMSKKTLASCIGVTPMAITHYENGERRPDMNTIKALAKALDVKVSDFLSTRNTNLKFVHAEFRRSSTLTKTQREFIREDVEEYMSRFYSIVDILGGEVLPDAPAVHKLHLTLDPKKDALQMRRYLGLPDSGPVGNLVELLENRGILVYPCDLESSAFSGMNGLVNERPYVVYNKNMSPARIRSTIAHELAHFIFEWPDDIENAENYATAVSGAFLFPEKDAKRELGLRRTRISGDMGYVCEEYGISMQLMIKRAALYGIITAKTEKKFYTDSKQVGSKKCKDVRIEEEEPFLFELLVFRAVSENEISAQKGAELLKKPYSYIMEHCFA